MTAIPDPPGYEEVRRKLVERGYLQGPIERFLLKDLLSPGSGGRGVVRTDLKAALLGGPILGALLAGAAVAANRPLLGVRDALVLWLYFALMAAAALFVLDLLASALVGALARRRGARPNDTLRAALIVGVPTLAYLVALWWRRSEASGTAADLAFLAAAVVATVLVAWLAGIASLAGILGRTGDVPRRMRRPVLALTAVLAAGAALAAFLFVASGGAGGSQPASPFDPIDTGPPLVLLGVDGLDGDLVEALAPGGAIEGLLAIMARGAVFPLKRPARVEPPEIWTTIATGMPAEVHGVRSVKVERLPGIASPLSYEAGPAPLRAALRFVLPGRSVPTTGEVRSVRTLWEIVALKSSSATVGWWATWPASSEETSEGTAYTISDRVLAKLLSEAPEDRDTEPASLFDRLRREFPERKEAWRVLFEREIAGREGRADPAWEPFLIDAFAFAGADLLLGDPEVRAAFVYLPGLDILRHRLAGDLRADGMARRAKAQQLLESYVRWLDARLAAQALAPGRRIVVVADPGRTAGPAAEGFVLAMGPPAVAGCVGPVLGLLDVAPLALGLAGFPSSREMPGRSPAACFEGLAAPAPVATFGRRSSAGAIAPSAFDAEMIERLRSLGYVR